MFLSMHLFYPRTQGKALEHWFRKTHWYWEVVSYTWCITHRTATLKKNQILCLGSCQNMMNEVSGLPTSIPLPWVPLASLIVSYCYHYHMWVCLWYVPDILHNIKLCKNSEIELVNQNKLLLHLYSSLNRYMHMSWWRVNHTREIIALYKA